MEQSGAACVQLPSHDRSFHLVVVDWYEYSRLDEYERHHLGQGFPRNTRHGSFLTYPATRDEWQVTLLRLISNHVYTTSHQVRRQRGHDLEEGTQCFVELLQAKLTILQFDNCVCQHLLFHHPSSACYSIWYHACILPNKGTLGEC